MLYPSMLRRNLFDDLFDIDLPSPRDFDRLDRKLYGRNADRLMKTDVQEHDDKYEVAIDLPGFKKEEINLQLENGYLMISASKNHDNEKKDHKGRVIRQERYMGAMSRSFYVGDQITEEDVKAKFEDGVLKLEIPKKEAEQLPEKKMIMIEG